MEEVLNYEVNENIEKGVLNIEENGRMVCFNSGILESQYQ